VEHLPHADLLVAERAGRIIGFIATYEIATHENYTGALFVAPEAQGSGMCGECSRMRRRQATSSSWASTRRTIPREPSTALRLRSNRQKRAR
jgi:hypothetical protein